MSNLIMVWWQRFKEARRQHNAAIKKTRVEQSLQLTVSQGRAFIAHDGIGIRALGSDLTLNEAISILESMRADAQYYADNEHTVYG